MSEHHSDSSPPPQVDQDSPVADASAWILRGGVILSTAIMLIGLCVAAARGTDSIARMQSDGFDYHLGPLLHGIATGRSKSIIEAGIYLLVLTPVMRVASSMVIFAFIERDRLYAVITAIVLVLTLAGLLWLG